MELARALRRVTIWGWLMLLVSGVVLVDIAQEFVGAPWTDVLRRAVMLIAGIAIGWTILQSYFFLAGRLIDRSTILGYLAIASFMVALWTIPATLPEPLFLGGMVGLLASWYPHCWHAVGVKEREREEREHTLPSETFSKPAA